MKFRTIWTLPASTLGEKLRRTHDWVAQEFGARLPVRVRYWVAMSALGKASIKGNPVDVMTLSEILRNLEKPKNLS